MTSSAMYEEWKKEVTLLEAVKSKIFIQHKIPLVRGVLVLINEGRVAHLIYAHFEPVIE